MILVCHVTHHRGHRAASTPPAARDRRGPRTRDCRRRPATGRAVRPPATDPGATPARPVRTHQTRRTPTRSRAIPRPPPPRGTRTVRSRRPRRTTGAATNRGGRLGCMPRPASRGPDGAAGRDHRARSNSSAPSPASRPTAAPVTGCPRRAAKTGAGPGRCRWRRTVPGAAAIRPRGPNGRRA